MPTASLIPVAEAAGSAAEAAYTIDSLHVGTMLVDGRESPVFAWLVRGAGRTILVDAGLPEPEVVQRRWGTECSLGGPGALVAALAAAGAEPADVDTLVLTHLHFDHAWNLGPFAGAQIVVQRAELLHAVDPVPTQRGAYRREVTVHLVGLRRPAQLLLIDGDHALADGIDALLVPGHTPGLMGLVVRTARGRAGLASDAGESYANWYPDDPRATDHPTASMAGLPLPPAIRTEAVLPAIEAMRRFRAHCEIVVPAHDWRIPRRLPDDWWELPPSPGRDL